VTIRSGLVLRLSHFLLIMLLLLVHVLHTTRLEFVHGFSALQLLFLVLKLLEVADVWLDLLLITLNHDIRPISADQDLSGDA